MATLRRLNRSLPRRLGLVFILGAAALAAQPVPDETTPRQQDEGESAADGESRSVNGDAEAAGRTRLNLLGEVDAEGGEGRRNENVRITLIDNNVLRELNIRMGTTATLVGELSAERSYFGTEFGGVPKRPPFLPGGASRAVHGELNLTHENSAFQARSFFQVGEVKPARANDYGFTVNLPVWRGAALTLDAGQSKQRGNVNGNILVPRADERTPLTNDSQDRAFVERILAAFPAELPNRTDIDPRALNTNDTQAIDNDRFSAKLDQQLGPDDRLAARYGFTSQAVEAFQLVGGQNPDTATKNHSAGLNWTRAWSATTQTDFFAGFERTGSLLAPDDTAVGPLVLTGFVVEFLGPSSDIPIDRAQNTFRYAGRWRQTRAHHTLTAGFETFRRQVNGLESESHRGVVNFANDFGRDAITNVRMGTPSRYTVAIGDVHRGFRNWDSQFYMGDDWRVRPNLTLNLGLQYRPVSSPSEVNGLSPIPYDCDCNNLAPRFGFALRPGGGWGVVRASYSISYGDIFPATYSQARFNPPLNINVSVNQPNLSDPLRDVAPEDLLPGGRSQQFNLAPELATPYSQLYGLTWEFSLPGGLRLDAGYVGSRSPKLLALWYANRARPVEGIELTTATVNDRRPDARFLEVRQIVNGSFGYFDAGKVELTLPRRAGLTLQASYWLSKAIDLGQSYTNKAAGRDGRTSRSPSEFDAHGEQRGVSDFDQSHAFLTRVNYETPALGRQAKWLRGVFGAWQLAAVMLFKTGTPFTVISGSDAPGFGNVDGTSADRPHILRPELLDSSIAHPDDSRMLLPTSAFAFITPGETAGNLGRNTFRKDGISNLNISLSRRWTLGGDRWTQLQAESLNLTNTPQFAEPGRELTSPNFGQITNTLNDGRTFRFTLRFGF